MRSFAYAQDDRSLLDPDVGGLHDLRPLRHLRAQESRELFGRRADAVGAEVGELGLDVFNAHDLRDFVMQALQRGRRRAGRRDQGVPFGDMKF